MPHVVVGRISKQSLNPVICAIAAVMLAALAPTPVHAQEPAAPPAFIAAVDGNATLEREGETTPAVVNMPLLPGDRVRTTAGRVEIRFPDGSGIEVVDYSAIELVTETRVRLLDGSIERLEPLSANVGAASSSYLPQDLRIYGGTFDQYGTWGYTPDYGNVWYPRVTADWRPYYYGYWEPIPRYGWTWIGADVWAWPTHHYGRWGYARGAWFWVPGRTFAGAWVSWGSAPGYVSWCPLGFDNRPVFALSTGIGRPYSGWTVVSRTHFGSRGYYAHRYAVDHGRLPRYTTFTQSTPSVAVPRHVTNGVPAGAGVAVPRGDRAIRAGAVQSRPAPPVTASPAVQPAPIVIPPVASSEPVRAGTWPSSHRRPAPSDQRQTPQEQRPTAYERRGTSGYQRPAANDERPRSNDPRPQRDEQRPQRGERAAAAPPAQAAQPQAPPPQQAVPRQAAPRQPPPPQGAAQQNSNGGGHGSGNQRAGTTAQPRAEAGSPPSGGARRR